MDQFRHVKVLDKTVQYHFDIYSKSIDTHNVSINFDHLQVSNKYINFPKLNIDTGNCNSGKIMNVIIM